MAVLDSSQRKPRVDNKERLILGKLTHLESASESKQLTVCGFLYREILYVCAPSTSSNFYFISVKTVCCLDRKALQKECKIENDRNRCVAAVDIQYLYLYSIVMLLCENKTSNTVLKFLKGQICNCSFIYPEIYWTKNTFHQSEND